MSMIIHSFVPHLSGASSLFLHVSVNIKNEICSPDRQQQLYIDNQKLTTDHCIFESFLYPIFIFSFVITFVVEYETTTRESSFLKDRKILFEILKML